MSLEMLTALSDIILILLAFFSFATGVLAWVKDKDYKAGIFFLLLTHILRGF